MFNPAVFENSRPDGIGVLEVAGGAGESRQFVPLKRTELHGRVTGPLASLRLVQTYGYRRSECDRVLEARYRFPLPGDAAVTGVRVTFGDVEIAAALKERGHAEADYEAAKREGRQAALTTREAPDVFTLQVAGLQPDQEVRVETSYVQLARAEGDGWTLRVPLTTPPRSVRRDERGTRQAESHPLRVLRDPGHRFSLDIELLEAGEVTSPTHPLAIEAAEPGRTRVRLREGEVFPDRDCVLHWRPRQERETPALQAFLHSDPGSEHVYFLAQLSPPAAPAAPPVPREVILLVDHSGSMEGAKWQAADWAVKQLLASLRPEDRFNLCLFHSSTRWLAEGPLAADPTALDRARRFLEHKDSGGTELGMALEQALRQERSSGEPARHVLILTDAQVSDEGRILRLAEEEGERSDRRRISLACIDAAPNSFLALELAERGGGEARFLTSAPDEEDITTALDELLAAWGAPVLANLKLEVGRPHLDTPGRGLLPAEPGWSAVDLGDLPAGRPLWVSGRVPRGETGDLSFRVSAGTRKVAAARVPLSQEASAGGALKALFGARRVMGLEFLISSGRSGDPLRDALRRLGFDPATVSGGTPAVYAENALDEAGKGLRTLLAREALEYGLASSETAFVAERREAGKPIEGTVDVASALPAGWSGGFVGSYSGTVRLARAITLAQPCSGPAPTSPPRPITDADLPAFLRSRTMNERTAYASAPEDSLTDASAATPYASTLGAAFGAAALDFLGHGAEDPDEVVDTFLKDAPPVYFSGVPELTAGGEAVLFDSAELAGGVRSPDSGAFFRLSLAFGAGAPDPDAVDPNLALLLFVDDLASPRARVRLADLVRQGGERPLNVACSSGQRVRLVLQDPSGAWASGAPEIEVRVE